ncbi:hypothetical protein VNO77_41508 [Canavalia gladiata]|uniref:Uncharacterized protein n=1 Tax=Canavalia gladiata TaxID=3824 RepID=A0AAN9JZH5_CANGL
MKLEKRWLEMEWLRFNRGRRRRDTVGLGRYCVGSMREHPGLKGIDVIAISRGCVRRASVAQTRPDVGRGENVREEILVSVGRESSDWELLRENGECRGVGLWFVIFLDKDIMLFMRKSEAI